MGIKKKGLRFHLFNNFKKSLWPRNQNEFIPILPKRIYKETLIAQ